MVLLLAVAVVVVLGGQLVVYEVSGKSNSRDAEAWEGAVEALPPGELAGIAPRLTISRISQYLPCDEKREGFCSAISPRSRLCMARNAFLCDSKGYRS